MSDGYSIEKSFLYAVASPADLARRLLTDVRTLETLAHSRSYRYFHLATGREVQEPSPPLQRLHRRVHDLLSRIAAPNYLHSAKGRSYITNAKAHCCNGPTIKLDIKTFFPSVGRGAIFRFFRDQMACVDDVAGLLARLLTVDGHLATGSSASPVLAYYAYKPMFDELDNLARSEGLVMTCYVDDLTMTGPSAGKRVLNLAHQIVRRHGLKSHREKHLKRPTVKLITGVAVTPTTVMLPRSRQQKIRAAYAASIRASSADEQLSTLKALASRLHEAAQVDPAAYRDLARRTQRRIKAVK